MDQYLDYEGLKVLKEKDDELYIDETEKTDITQLPQSDTVSDSDLLIKGVSSTGELYSITFSDLCKNITISTYAIVAPDDLEV